MIVVFDTSTEPEVASEEPTSHLRFLDGRLQQTWKINRYQGGKLYRQDFEWRDVTTEATLNGGTEP